MGREREAPSARSAGRDCLITHDRSTVSPAVAPAACACRKACAAPSTALRAVGSLAQQEGRRPQCPPRAHRKTRAPAGLGRLSRALAYDHPIAGRARASAAARARSEQHAAAAAATSSSLTQTGSRRSVGLCGLCGARRAWGMLLTCQRRTRSIGAGCWRMRVVALRLVASLTCWHPPARPAAFAVAERTRAHRTRPCVGGVSALALHGGVLHF